MIEPQAPHCQRSDERLYLQRLRSVLQVALKMLFVGPVLVPHPGVELELLTF
jgi:hypothetical protein